MSTSPRRQGGSVLPSFEGEAEVYRGEEADGGPSALVIAIYRAGEAAGEYLAANNIGTTTFELSKISVVVSPNPGPTTYRAIISPGG